MGCANREARELLDASARRAARPDGNLTWSAPSTGRPSWSVTTCAGAFPLTEAVLSSSRAAVGGGGELVVGHDWAVRAGDFERLVPEPPDERRIPARGDCGEARHARRRAVVSGDGREGIAGDVERAAAALPRSDAALQPPAEPGELGREHGDARLVPIEGRPAPGKLDRRRLRRRRRTGRSTPRRSRRSRARTTVAARSSDSTRSPSISAARPAEADQTDCATSPPSGPGSQSTATSAPVPCAAASASSASVCSIGAPAASERAARAKPASASATSVLARLPIKVRRAARPRARSSASAAR